MAGTCGGSLVKLILALFNFACMGIGAFIIYLGMQTFQFNDENVKELINANLNTGALVLVVFGSAVMVLAAIGFLGACCESTTLLNFYGIVILILLVLNVIGLYYGHKYIGEFKTNVSSGIQNGIRNFEKDPKLAYALQKIQTIMQCCGWEGPSDYASFISEYPTSCCSKNNYSIKEPFAQCTRSQLVFTSGCKNSPFIQSFTGNVTYTAYALILIILVVVLAACCLARDLKANY